MMDPAFEPVVFIDYLRCAVQPYESGDDIDTVRRVVLLFEYGLLWVPCCARRAT